VFLRVKNSEATRSGDKKSAIISLPEDLISFRQLRLFGAQAGDIDLYDGDDISKVTTSMLTSSIAGGG
jgi:hypothetical protein